MIEILFSEGAAGSILDAIKGENKRRCSTDDIGRTEGKCKSEYDEVEQKDCFCDEINGRVEREQQIVACFPLGLSMGDVLEPFSEERAEFLQSLVRIGGDAFSDVGRELVEAARKGLERLRTAEGPFRIWTSCNPDEFCGLCHVLTLLPKDAEVRVVELPEYEVIGKELRTYSGWGEIEPTEFVRFQALERVLTDTERRYFSALWRELRSENGPLRAVVSGRLCTVGADFYDWLILRALAQEPEQFHEARFIGTVLGKYPLGISDWLIAQRIGEFISRGMLTPVTEPEKGHPIYHRYLRKMNI